MYFNTSLRNPGYAIDGLYRDVEDLNTAQPKAPKRSLDFGFSDKKPKKIYNKKVRITVLIMSSLFYQKRRPK